MPVNPNSASGASPKSDFKWFDFVIVLAIAVMIAYWAGQANSNGISSLPNQTTSTASTQISNQAQGGNLDDQNKCAQDGARFINTFEIENNQSVGGYRPVWFNPQYHYNAKLNTCLAYIGYVQESSEWGAGTSDYTINSMIENFVFNIYSNEPVIQSVDNRVTTNGNNEDTLATYALYSEVPNITESNFNQQMQILMNE